MPRFFTHRIAYLPIWLWQLMPIVIAAFFSSVAFGALLTQNYLLINDNRPSVVSNYHIGFTLGENENIGSIEIQFCSNSPIVSMSCAIPSGMDVSGATLVSQSGVSGFSIAPGVSSYSWVLTNPSAPLVNSGALSFLFDGIQNPSTEGSYYVRIQTFASTDATGSALDVGGIAFSINNAFTITTTVPPYLYFCSAVTIANYHCDQTSGDYINFGDLSTRSTSTASSQIVIATNAQNGYAIQLSGSDLTSGNNVVPALTSPAPAIPGSSQFGLNLVGNSQPLVGNNDQGPGSGNPTSGYAQPNDFKFASGDLVATSNQVSDFKQFTVSYIVDIGSNQPPGVYATTLTYVAMANF